MPARYNLATALVAPRLATEDRNRPAVEYQGRVWTFAEIADLIDRVGHGLRALGVTRGQRVLIALPDSPAFIAAFLGAIKIGAVAVPCNTFVGATEYRHFIDEARAPVLITTSEIFGRIEPATAAAPDMTIVLVDQSADARPARTWQSWIEASSPTLAAAETTPDETAFWLWTSGSTGQPKAAVHRHQDPAWCCRLVAGEVLGMSRDDRVFSAAKLFHAFGLGNGLFFPFWFGATSMLYPGRATPDALYGVLNETKPTIFFGVPTHYAGMLQTAEADRRLDLSSLRFAVSAAEPLPAELYTRWRARFGTEILDGIGSTELLHMYICTPPGRAKPGSSGIPVPGYDVRVVDDTGNDVGPNQVGDLLVKGPSAARMYWNRPEDTAKKMRGEWFASGDNYRVDEDGYYWYAGRSDDMFKTAGEWISPTEIESVLMAHPAVLECAVVPHRDASDMQRPKACVVLKDGHPAAEALIAELQDLVRGRLAHYKCPRAIEFLPDLPKTATGKIQRFKLRE